MTGFSWSGEERKGAYPNLSAPLRVFNLIAATLVFAAVFIAVVVGTWPDPPWTLLTWGGAAMMVGLPLLFFPFARTIFLAFDLIFRPQKDDSPRGPEV